MSLIAFTAPPAAEAGMEKPGAGASSAAEGILR